MPHVFIHLIEQKSRTPIVNGAWVSVQQDRWLEGFKELFKQEPNAEGVVDFEATSATKYRIVGDGAFYHSNELLIDTGFNFVVPIHVDLPLERRAIPLPDVPSLPSVFRDVGLGQTMPFVIGLVAIAVIVIALAYLSTKIPVKKVEAKHA